MEVILEIIRDIADLVPNIAEGIGNELIIRTPKDTEHAVGNWRVSVDRKETSEIGKYPGSGSGQSQAQNSLSLALNEFDVTGNRYISFDQNTSYFQYLDNSPFHSDQAPGGIVDLAVEAGLSKALSKIRF